MQLPIEKLRQVEYYEVTSAIKAGVTDYKDRITLHYGEYEKEYKLFGITVWSKTIPDRTESFEFNRIQQIEDDGSRSYSKSKPFRKLYEQLELYFSSKRAEYILEHLKYHELEYVRDVY